MPSRLFGLLAVSCFVLPGARADEPKQPETKPLATIAHIKLSGSLDESPTSDEPLFGSAAENFKAKLDRIRTRWMDYFNQATEGRGTVETNLVPR